MTASAATVFSRSDLSSPLAYPSSQTALLLLDYHSAIVSRLGAAGTSAVTQAALMRDWALANSVMIVHGLIDVSRAPFPTCKDAGRIKAMMEEFASTPEAVSEPASIASMGARKEVVTTRVPGVVSALKAEGLMELLRANDVRSLVLCGLSTSGVVLRTAVPASDEEFVVTVIEDACADPTEGLHDMLVNTVLPSRAHVTNVEQWKAKWNKV